jgi:methylmalonyl-CoA/ethylmalonyl-CoA epimerase
MLDKNGVCPYHVCYEADAFDAVIAGFRKHGFSLLFRPRPAVLFDGRRICYLYHKNMGLVELLERRETVDGRRETGDGGRGTVDGRRGTEGRETVDGGRGTGDG